MLSLDKKKSSKQYYFKNTHMAEVDSIMGFHFLLRENTILEKLENQLSLSQL